MSELLDRIPGPNSIGRALRAVVDTTHQIKARQRMTGRSGQLGYAIDSENDWDYTTTVSSSSSTFQIARFRIIFTGNGTQKYPIAVPQFDVRINGTAESNRMEFNPDANQYQYEDAAVEVMAFEYGKPDSSYFESETQSAWIVELFHIRKVSNGSFSLRIKPRAQASSGGTFSVVRVV